MIGWDWGGGTVSKFCAQGDLEEELNFVSEQVTGR